MTMSCSYFRPSTSIDPNPRNRTSMTSHRSPHQRAPWARRNSYLTIWALRATDTEKSPAALLDELAALDPSQRREVAKELRKLAETFAEVGPDGRHSAQALQLLAACLPRCVKLLRIACTGSGSGVRLDFW